MPSNDATPERCTDLPSDVLRLGVDGEGYDHFISPYHQTVYILDDGDLDRTVDVHGRSLTVYEEWVSRSRGEWRQWFCTGPGLSGLIDHVAAAVTTDGQASD